MPRMVIQREFFCSEEVNFTFRNPLKVTLRSLKTPEVVWFTLKGLVLIYFTLVQLLTMARHRPRPTDLLQTRLLLKV